MSEETRIKVVMLEPGKVSRITEIGTSLESMQEAVGGSIECFEPFRDPVCIICNEENKLNETNPNRSVSNEKGVLVDFIFGPAFICASGDEDFESLSKEQADRYLQKFRHPERIVNIGGEIKGIPYKPSRDMER